MGKCKNKDLAILGPADRVTNWCLGERGRNWTQLGNNHSAFVHSIGSIAQEYCTLIHSAFKEGNHLENTFLTPKEEFY